MRRWEQLEGEEGDREGRVTRGKIGREEYRGRSWQGKDMEEGVRGKG